MRSTHRLEVPVSYSTPVVDWDWVVDAHSCGFTAVFRGTDGQVEEIMKVDKHSAEDGQCKGQFAVPSSGVLELVWSNSHTLWSRTVSVQVLPQGLLADQAAEKRSK